MHTPSSRPTSGRVAPFLNGLMLDPARMPLQMDWYRRLIPWLGRWGYNTLLLNLADDSGCALRLACRPELSSRMALTHEEVRELVGLASAHGLTLVPMIATLGHTGYIYWRDPYRHLVDGLTERGRKVLCPARAESRRLLTEILEEVMALFPGPYLHVGLDESGELPKKTCRQCSQKFAGLTEPDFIARQLAWLCALAERRGKQLLFWAFGKLKAERDEVITRDAPASAIACLWYYEEKKADLDDRAVAFFIRKRRPLLGVPSLACWPNTTVLPNQANLDNIRRFAAIIHRRARRPEVRGLVNSVWQHTYTLPGTLIYGMAYAADQFRRPGGSPRFAARFARAYFGAPVGRLLRDLHACAPRYRELDHVIECSSAADIRGVSPEESSRARAMGRRARALARALRRARPAVKTNRDIFDAYLLAADILAHWGDRAAVLAAPAPARAALARLAARARILADRAWRAWDAAYDPKHPWRTLRQAPDTVPPPPVNIDRYCYCEPGFHSNKHVFASLEWSARFLARAARRPALLRASAPAP